ncbi:nuclear transport factor 2 family protein [Dactylosporangium siamense]|uniref:SnoaL-like domain-containing protein n=1 Tax=Dactylosporangium siamense TaxID=685454 RepID=A0A919U9E4_9ACTN|nr:nuclear transport factor 2 family protein [Dactylosporangium siamense]GIG42568.1 hypothetical protein Dsi01nite_006090 [Dactylosporangium siamense]
MEHPNADLVRRAFAAFESGDLATIRALFAADIVWRVGGHGPASGETVGLDAVLANFQQIMTWTAGDYAAHPVDFLGSDRHAVALTRARASRPDGRTLDVAQAVVFEVAGGRLVSCQHMAYDEAAWDAFFE